ncbi:hypothetical protein TOPH_02025 [Tolypocladium ophioglossoides CBS 100239]|uniref:Mid2 domain-containing protein n=1 Tax=Tolypocladium ophioglossoides (strain CBS 100239) TaxID=1163406 RepID=A0A0L0NGU8_TOLOC|nr:hypothetical protein TOPH_02025 [Tolypocladium ophioglossoides CBS 100239]
MRLSLGLALGALLGAAQASRVLVRQVTAPTASSAPSAPSSPSSQSSQSSPSLLPPSTVTSSQSTPATTPPANTGGGDTTVLVTRTVSGEVQTVTKFTTIVTTVVSTVVVTSTDFSTTTVTSSDQATATKTVYETSTQFVNQKRSLDPELAPRTAAPAAIDAAATVGLQQHQLAKRATITQFTTVTVGSGSGGTTIVNTVVNTVKTVVTTDTTTTSVVTETDQANAKTTVTVTSTLVITSTRVTTGVVETSTGAPTGNNGGGSGSGSDSGGSDSGGLSTGAKAGIGIGAGLGALAVVAAIAFFCMRRRRSPKPDHDDFIGASEVPVGGPASGGSGSRRSRPMSESAPAAGFPAPGRAPVKQSVSPEGYRGTAMGDGRAGYAKPAPFGSAYTQSPSNTMTQQSRNNAVAGDQLPRHPTPGDSSIASPTAPSTAELGSDGATAAKWHNSNAAEIDSHAVSSRGGGPVYEMPAQEYQ